MTWKITAIGEETGREYVYDVLDAPLDAHHVDLAVSAYRQHGTLLAARLVSELLSPQWRAEWVWEDRDVQS